MPVSKDIGQVWPTDWVLVDPGFYGRNRELEDLKSLTRTSYRPIGIYGMGGIG